MSAYVVIVYYQEIHAKPTVTVFDTDKEAEAAIIADAQDDWHMLFPEDREEVEYPTTLEQAFALAEYMYDSRKVWLIRDGEAYHHERKEES